MFETVSAGIVLAICVVFLIRLLVGAKRRAAIDGRARLAWWQLRQGWQHLRQGRSSRKSAQQLADEAIRRARDDGHWEGNVYKPKSFKRPPRDKMH
jgi:hypothetical protein